MIKARGKDKFNKDEKARYSQDQLSVPTGKGIHTPTQQVKGKMQKEHGELQKEYGQTKHPQQAPHQHPPEPKQPECECEE